MPTQAPTEAPGSPTPSPQSDAPSQSNGLEQQIIERFRGITIQFVGVSELQVEDKIAFEEISESWFEGYFLLFGDSEGLHDMKTRVSFQGERTEMVGTVRVNTITYDQWLSFRPSGATLTPEELVLQPFRNLQQNELYASLLKSRIDAFTGVEVPVQRPIISTSNASNTSDGMNSASIAGIVVGVVVGLALTLGSVYMVKTRVKSGRERTLPVGELVASNPLQNCPPQEPASALVVPVLADHRNDSVNFLSFKDQTRQIRPQGTNKSGTHR